jgi:hypothetical protein
MKKINQRNNFKDIVESFAFLMGVEALDVLELGEDNFQFE